MSETTQRPYEFELPIQQQVELRFKCIGVVSSSLSDQNRTLKNILIAAELLYEWLLGKMKAADYDSRVPWDIKSPL